jgi:hypothetical protein
MALEVLNASLEVGEVHELESLAVLPRQEPIASD